MNAQIVYLLKAVQIDQQDSDLLLVAMSVENRLLKAVLEPASVGEIGERIARRLKRELRVHFAVLDDNPGQLGRRRAAWFGLRPVRCAYPGTLPRSRSDSRCWIRPLATSSPPSRERGPPFGGWPGPRGARWPGAGRRPRGTAWAA